MRRIFPPLLLAFLVSAMPAAAVEPLASEDLLNRCSAAGDTAEMAACRAWIQGFLGGAFAARIASLSPEERESFTNRAIRTRGADRRNEFGRNPQAGFCIPRETTLDQLIAELNRYAPAQTQRPEEANQLMLGLLGRRYRCP